MSFLSYVINLPAKLGRAASAGSVSVTLASDDAAVAALDAIEASTAAGSTAANQTAGNTLLTAISSALAGILSVFTKNVQVTGNLTVADPTGNTAGSTVTINTDSIGGLGIKIAGSGVGTILFQGSVDGVTWDNPKVYPISVGAQGVTSTTTIGDFEANPGAFKQFRVCLSALSSGTFSVTFNGTAAIKHVGVKNGNPADLQATTTPIAASLVDRSTTINGTVSSASITAGGANYAIGNTITLANGVVLTVATISGSAVASVTVTTPGNVPYAAMLAMTNPVPQVSTSGSGTGATFGLAWVGVATQIAPANTSRKSLEVINPGTADLWLSPTIANPSVNGVSCIPLSSRGGWSPPLPYQSAIYVYGATPGQPVTAFEG